MAEKAIGLFDVALSFTVDAVDSALALQAFADFYDVRCYHYQNYLVRQSGLPVREVMRHVYTTARLVVILNTPLYGSSVSTCFELGLVQGADPRVNAAIVELGGRELDVGPRSVERYNELTDETAIRIMSGAGRNARPSPLPS